MAKYWVQGDFVVEAEDADAALAALNDCADEAEAEAEEVDEDFSLFDDPEGSDEDSEDEGSDEWDEVEETYEETYEESEETETDED